MTWTTRDIPEDIFSDPTLSETIRTLLAQRGVTSGEQAQTFLHPDYTRDTHDPMLLSGMDHAIQRILHAREQGERVGIFGDHDVDGVSAATIMHEGLTMLEISHDTYIPCKHSEGHGLNATAIDQFHADGVTLMITVDCGISDHDMVDYAREKGIETIIVDHHQIPDKLPAALSIVNPHLPDDPYPFDNLCGAACAFKVVEALIARAQPDDVDQLKWMLDLVAIATVADCMPLVGESRTLVTYGLIVLAKTRRRSLQEMIAVGEMPIAPETPPTAHTIGFHIGPRLNAAGRMGHARDAYHFLIETDPAAARVRAQDLEDKNVERRKLTDKVLRSAQKQIRALLKEDTLRQFLFVADASYPIGIVGIVAGRLAREHARPVGVFVEEGDTLRGSFRSIDGVDMMTILRSAETHLTKYGGHAGAAGATLAARDRAAFVAQADETARMIAQQSTARDLTTVTADLTLHAADIRESLVDDLARLAPYGQSNPEPLLSITGLIVQSARTVGSTDKHLKMTCQIVGQDHMIDIIGFDFGKDLERLLPGVAVDVLGHLSYNEWMGNRSIQITMKDWREGGEG